MSLLLSAVAATQLCAGCTIEFEPVDTLGAAEDPAGVGMFADVLKIGDQGYLVSSDVLGGVVIVYDAEGRYQRELTREGDGPGELRSPPQFAMGSGGIVLLPPASSALHLYSSDLEFNKTFQVPGIARAIGFDPMTEGWLVSYFGAGDGSEFGILLVDQGGDVVRALRAARESLSLGSAAADVMRGAGGTIWVATNAGIVEVFDQDLGLLGSLRLELPGMDERDPRAGPGGAPAAVYDIRRAPDGTGVWVFAFAPVVSLSDLLDELMESPGRPPDFERLLDTFIYSVQVGPSGLTLVGPDQLDTLVRPLGDGDLAYDLVDTPDGNRRVRVGRIRFAKGSG